MGKHLCPIYFSVCASVCVCVCVLLLPVLEKDSEKVSFSYGRHHSDEVNENGRRACVCMCV